MAKILEKQKLCPDTFMMKLDASIIARKAQPGQFVILKIDEEGERIPLTIADYDLDSITIMFKAIGRTTDDLSALDVGDEIQDIVGPLGTPSELASFGTVVMIGGGVGIAAIYPQARAMKKVGNNIISIIGARSKEFMVWEEKMRDVSDELIVCSDDGSIGRKGFVTDALKEVIEKNSISRIVAVGPTVMMRFVTKAAGDIPVIVSLNPIMIDGMGMCGGCRVLIDGKVKYACVDGPEFIGQDVDWDDLMNRNSSYKDEECRCRCEK